jgi:hypothetical protein
MYPRQYYEPNLLVRNQLEVVKWLHEHRAGGCTTGAMDSAAANGNFDLVKWLHENTAAGCTHEASLLLSVVWILSSGCMKIAQMGALRQL